ncbi:MAG: ChbG/HpnK family deacetylase [Candidatus Omnitrophota bacterium]
MKLLIINVDDVGISDAVNEAARKCYFAGAITGVSLMACGQSFREACSMLRGLEKRQAGVHLTLTGPFVPATEDRTEIDTLLSGPGTFLYDYRRFAARYILGKINPHQIRLEFTSQIKKVEAEGFTVTHLDSHEHIHMFPGIFNIVVELALERGINYIRIPEERTIVAVEKFAGKDLIRHMGLKMFIRYKRMMLSNTGIASNTAFLGHFHSGRIDEGILCFMMTRVGEGVTELGMHPGEENSGFLKEFPWYKNSPKELEALLEGKWRETAAARGIHLVSHAEAVAEMSRKG